jgi:hypothetical protein
MASETESTNLPEQLDSRSIMDRRPLTVTFVLAELLLIVLAATIFFFSDPMAPDPSFLAVTGGILIVVALMIAVIGVLVLLINVTLERVLS